MDRTRDEQDQIDQLDRIENAVMNLHFDAQQLRHNLNRVWIYVGLAFAAGLVVGVQWLS